MDSTTYPFALPVTCKVNGKEAKKDYRKKELTIIWNLKKEKRNEVH